MYEYDENYKGVDENDKRSENNTVNKSTANDGTGTYNGSTANDGTSTNNNEIKNNEHVYARVEPNMNAGPNINSGQNMYAGQNPQAGQNINAGQNMRVIQGNKTKKNHSTAKKIWATIGIAALFGVVASTTFFGVNRLVDKVSSKVKITIDESGIKDKLEDAEDKIADAVSGIGKEDENSSDTNNSQKKVGQVDITDDGTAVNPQNTLNSEEYSIEQVAAAAMPSIVAITNKSVQDVRTFYGTGVNQYESTSAGSGIIIGQNDNELLIATNAHVVEGADTLSVAFIDDEVYEAYVKGSDSTNDIALVGVNINDIKESTLDQIKIAKIGNSDDLVIGQKVVAIGNALGYGQSVTTGIVSALNRTLDGTNSGTGYIQTDAAINPGNSGGALLNMKGEVIGINSAKLANTMIEGMGYAIPIDTASPVFEGLINLSSREAVAEDEEGYLGIVGSTVTSDVSKAYGIPCGAYVSEVYRDGAADNAGIRKGDIITKFDGMDIDSINTLKSRLQYYKVGEEVEVVVYRYDEGEYVEKSITVTLMSKYDVDMDEQ